MNHWLRTDEYEEVASSLEFLAYCSSKLEGDVYYWKWLIISLHSGLQGFMVIALRDSAGLNILKDSIAAEWLRAYRVRIEENLNSMKTIYEGSTA